MAQLLSSNVSGTLNVSQNTTIAGNLIVSGYNVLNEIFQADNLARVTANSGSAQSAVSLNFVNTATVQVSVTSGGAGVANIGFTSTATGGGTGTLNNFPVSVNTGSTVTSNGINFVNTSTVTISVSQGINGNANISFTSISGGSGTVTSVGTGIGLTGGPVTSSGTISANIASTTVQGVTKLIDSVASTDTANAATAASVKTAYDQATLAYTQANTANTVAVSAYGQANLAYTQANTGVNTAIAAYGQANTAYNTANTSANTTAVSANSGPSLSKVSLNFVNTSTVQVSVVSGIAGVANVSFTSAADGVTSVATGLGLTGGTITSTGTISANIASTTVQGITKLIDVVNSTDTGNAATGAAVKTAYDQATLAYGQANLAYTQANTGTTTAQSAYGQANLAYAQANTGVNTAIAAYGQANSAFTAANIGINRIISANSGSIQSNVSLNFVNTATIKVTVGAGTTGNANVSFDYIGSVTGGSGINTFPVSANSGATVTANGVNFVNSATVTVLVTQGVNGNANVSFTSTGGTGTPGGVDQNIQYNNGGSFGGSNNLTYNATSQAISTNGNVIISNVGGLYFGSSQTNPTVTNSKVLMQYNVSTQSLDIVYLG